MWQTFQIRPSFLIIFPVVFFYMKIYYFILQIKKIKYEMKWNFFIGFDATDCYLTAGCAHCFRLKLPDVAKTLLSWWCPGYSSPAWPDNDEGWGRLSWFFLSISSLQVRPCPCPQIWIHLFSGLGLNCWTGLESVEDPARWKQCDLKRGFRTCYTKYDPRRLNVLSSDSTVWRWRGEQFI